MQQLLVLEPVPPLRVDYARLLPADDLIQRHLPLWEASAAWQENALVLEERGLPLLTLLGETMAGLLATQYGWSAEIMLERQRELRDHPQVYQDHAARMAVLEHIQEAMRAHAQRDPQARLPRALSEVLARGYISREELAPLFPDGVPHDHQDLDALGHWSFTDMRPRDARFEQHHVDPWPDDPQAQWQHDRYQPLWALPLSDGWVAVLPRTLRAPLVTTRELNTDPTFYRSKPWLDELPAEDTSPVEF